MHRFKMLSVLASTIAMVALSATSASATWTSNSTQTTGTITVNKAGEFTVPPGDRFKCNASEIKAQWQIQGTGQIKEQQKITTSGPHLQVQIKNWGKGCLINGSSEVAISECDFQLVQQSGAFTATIGVSKRTCIMNLENACTIQIPVGMEGPQGSSKGINVGLTGVALTNSGTNQIDKAAIRAGGQGQLPGEAIFASSPGAACGFIFFAGSTEEIELIGFEFTAEGVKAI